MNEELFGILNDADEVIESVNCDPFGMTGVTLEGINVATLTPDQMKDPFVVKQLKKQIQSAKKWQTVLGVITKLNVLLSGGMMVGGAVYAKNTLSDPNNNRYSVDLDPNPNVIKRQHRGVIPEAANNAILAVLVPILQLAISVLTTLVKKALANKELTNITVLNGQIDKSISLYEKQLKSNISDREKQKLESAISDLENLKTFLNKEGDRLTR